MKYRTKIQAQETESIGEINDEPSMTIEGEHQEMKDILAHAMQGMDIPRKDAQYFRPDEIQQINSLYRQSLDLTDIDQLRQKNQVMTETLNSALQRKQEAEAEKQKEQTVTETQTQPTE